MNVTTPPMPMTVQDHIRTAFGFLTDSDREFAAGDVLQASEKLWGAASHAVIAVAESRGWEHDSHRALRTAVLRLDAERGDLLIRAGFLAAEKFHINFHYKTMDDSEIEEERPLVHEFVRQVTALASENSANGR